MTDDAESHRPIRQWRVLLTEDRDGRVRAAMLAWRTFPCAATKWDGTRWYTFPSADTSPVTALDALRALLLQIGEGEWYEARYPRHDRR